jgi:two-component system nitrate/nitrite response regulator NarL
MSAGMSDLRVLVVAADPLARMGLMALLDDQPGCEVVGQAAPDDDLPYDRFDVVVWDMGWDPSPAMLEALRAELAGAAVPVLVLLPDETRALEVWHAGGRGLLMRDAGGERIAAGLTALTEGLVVLDPPLAEALLPVAESAAVAPVEDLTPREREVLQLMAQGLANRAIAYHLGISEHTVKFHVNAILSKLGAQSRTDAVVRASRLGLIIL